MGTVNRLEGRASIQRDLDRHEEWADRNRLKFDKDRCKALHLGERNSLIQAGDHVAAEKNFRVLVGSALRMRKLCSGTKGGHSILGCKNRSTASRSREVIISLQSALP